VPILLAPESGRVMASRPTLVLLVSLFLGHRVLREIDHAAWPTAVAARPAPPRDARSRSAGYLDQLPDRAVVLVAHSNAWLHVPSVREQLPERPLGRVAAVAGLPSSWVCRLM
jgi:hypothetical protein